MRSRDIKSALERWLDQLVHASVIDDQSEARRQRGFIATHLASGCLAFCLMPACLVGDTSLIDFTATAMAVLGLEVLAALYVSHTGNLARGYLMSAAVLTTLVSWVALHSGGLSSFSIVWFAIVPIEAAMSGRRQTILAATSISAIGFIAVTAIDLFGASVRPLTLAGDGAIVNTTVSLLGLAYAFGVAIGIERRERLSQRAATLQENRYRLLADTMSDLVTCHATSGDVSFVSPAATRLAATRPADLLGDGLFRRVHVADRPAYLAALSQALHAGSATVEFRLRCGDETEVETWIWVEAHMRRPDADTVEGAAIVTVTRNISERKRHETELETCRNEAEAASFAKTRFLANMSHELRTPLNAIIGFSDILTQELFGKFEFDRQREYSQLIKESGEHLLQVVNDILDLSKIESGTFDVTPEPFELPPIAKRCVQILRPQAEQAGVELSLEVEPGLPEIVADPRSCRQILLNLLSNAVKFTDRGGSVVCSVRRDGRRIALAVRDTGIGIAADDLPRLGQPFVQADSGYDRKHEGTGLGLSVVKGLVQLHGGQLRIDSIKGKGTTVLVLLPISANGHETVTQLPRIKQVIESQRAARRA